MLIIVQEKPSCWQIIHQNHCLKFIDRNLVIKIQKDEIVPTSLKLGEMWCHFMKKKTRAINNHTLY